MSEISETVNRATDPGSHEGSGRIGARDVPAAHYRFYQSIKSIKSQPAPTPIIAHQTCFFQI
jgi:hypothetical protein